MKKQSYKTFLINEIQRLTGNQTRSLLKWSNQANARVKAVIVAYMLEEDRFITNTSNENLKQISFEALKIKIGKGSEYENDALRYKEFYAGYIKHLSFKKRLMDKKIDRSTLYKACKSLEINYGNAFNFFINKKQSFLTEEKATNILLFKEYKKPATS